MSVFAAPTVAARPFPRELERALVRFRARVAEEHLVGERQLHETRRELLAGRRAEQVRYVNQAVGGGVQRLAEPFVTVA